MAISFNAIPTTVKVPGAYIEFDNSIAQQTATLMEYTALICGQKTSAGSASERTAYTVTSADEARGLFGAGSQLALMAEAFIKNNSYTSLKCMAIEDGDTFVAAAGTITLTGTSTAAGTVYLYVGGKSVSCACAASTTGAALATALAAAINADADLPVTAEAAADEDEATTGVITVTARNAGLCGNEIDLRFGYYGEEFPAGITPSIVAMAGGTGAPDLDTFIQAWGDQWYHVIAWPWNDRASLATLSTELEDRWGPLRHIDGVAITSKSGAYTDLQDFGSGSGAGNYAHISIVECCQSPDLPCRRAAAVAAVVSYYGNIDPARPFQTLTLKGCLPPAESVRLTFAQANLLLAAGIATTAVDAGGTVSVQRLVTNYLTTSTGAADTSFQDVNTLLTLSYLRYDFRARILRKYPRHKLAGDSDLIPVGQAIMTPAIGRAEAIAAFRDWQELGLVENMEDFKAGLVCERNATDVNRLDWLLQPDLINQFRVAAVQIQFKL